MKKNVTNHTTTPEPQPALDWQTGSYSRDATFEFTLPYPFLLLCKLMDVTPEQLLLDFTTSLSFECWQRESLSAAREHLVNYFIAHGYGQHRYSEKNIRKMFKEMEALSLLFPHEGESELLESYANWRDKHHTYWFERWRCKL